MSSTETIAKNNGLLETNLFIYNILHPISYLFFISYPDGNFSHLISRYKFNDIYTIYTISMKVK